MALEDARPLRLSNDLRERTGSRLTVQGSACGRQSGKVGHGGGPMPVDRDEPTDQDEGCRGREQEYAREDPDRR
jgi:hypothetical protein